ncbi:MAG: phage tail tape measure protein, partial [Acidobacteria bacterium]|nr:phage tail tape measure protein [Acidobacteriota bacterium]
MSILGEAQVRVGADTSTFDGDVTSGLKRTAGGLSGIGSTIATGLAVGATAMAGLGAAAFANTARVGEMADSLLDLKAVTGASTDQLQEWRFVAASTGQKTDFFGDSVKQLNRTMTQLEDGTGKGSDALSRLGVSVRDSAGNMKSSAQITNDAIIALSGMTDVSLRAQLATDIFSRKANELIPVLDEGAAGLEAMKLQAHDLGGVLSEDALAAADHFRQSLAVLHTQVTGVGNAVGANLAPVLDSVVQFISNKVLPVVIDLSERFGAWWTKMQDGPGIMANIKDALGNMLSGDMITKVMGGIQSAMQTGIEAAATWIRSGGLTSLVE